MAIQDVLPPLIVDRDGVDGASHDRVHRFGTSERFLHWWIVVMFASALLTGVAMGDEAESGSMLKLHIGSVVLIGVGLVIALVFGNTMAILRSARDLFFFDRIDIAFVVNTVRHPGHPDHVRWGKFNIGQKILAWSLVGSLAAVVVTGINSWSAGGRRRWTSRGRRRGDFGIVECSCLYGGDQSEHTTGAARDGFWPCPAILGRQTPSRLAR